jgi:hypothetical protein
MFLLKIVKKCCETFFLSNKTFRIKITKKNGKMFFLLNYLIKIYENAISVLFSIKQIGKMPKWYFPIN